MAAGASAAARLPGAAEIHLWHVALAAGAAARPELAACLSEDERARAERFVFRRDHDRFVAARASLRHILGAYLGLPASDVAFRYADHGKPGLDPAADAAIAFNLAHSGDRALLAVAAGVAVGIDIELIRPEAVSKEMMSEVFSAAERAAIAALPSTRQVAAFFKGWTSKEAYIKGLGDGLAIPLGAFDVCVNPDRPARLLSAYAGAAGRGNWSLHGVGAPPGYAATLAAAGPPERILARLWLGPAS